MKTKITIYKIKDYYKIIETPLHNKELTILNKNINTQKLFNNITRAKTNISNLILCNDFKYFLTATINSNYDRYNLVELKRIFNSKIRQARFKYGLKLHYLIVPEKHKNGAWHFHGVLDSSFFQFIYLNENKYESCKLLDSLGFNSVTKIRNIEKVSSYITKYVSKDFENRQIGSHLYFASQNLKRPERVFTKDFEEQHNYYKDNIFNFKNDYCKLGKLTEKEYYNLIKNLTLRK